MAPAPRVPWPLAPGRMDRMFGGLPTWMSKKWLMINWVLPPGPQDAGHHHQDELNHFLGERESPT